MISKNLVFLEGRIGQDPKVINTDGGTKMVAMSLATSESFKKNEEWVEKTQWHNIITFGKTAEYAEKYAKKGSIMFVESGKIEYSSYEDKDGVKRNRTQISARSIRIETPRSESQPESQPASQPAATAGVDDLPF